MANISLIAAQDSLFAAEGAAYLSSSLARDAVAIFDNNNVQLFYNARPLRADIVPRAKLMEHPIENGQIITDYKITLPMEIRIPVVVAAKYYIDTYQQIYNAWLNSTVLTVQTHIGVFVNMVIAEMPSEENPDRYDVITINLLFRQIPVVGGLSNFNPLNPTQASTSILGYQIPSIYAIAGTALGIASSLRVIAEHL